MSVLAYMGYYYYDVTYLLVILGCGAFDVASAQVNARLNVTAAFRSSAADRSRGCGADFIPERSDECAD